MQEDEAWNPKMKMSRLEPKKDRPVRDSAKNIAIEKGKNVLIIEKTSFKKGFRITIIKKYIKNAY